MRYKTLYFLLISIISLAAFGCGGTETPNKPENTNSVPSTANSNNPLTTTKTPEIATTNEAPTFTPLVKAYCEAIMKKDDAMLRKIHSADTLKIYDEDMKSENKSSLSEFLGELDVIKDVSKCGARNETVEGDKGVAEIRNENMPNGITIEFVKENGEWKLTNKSPTVKKLQESATNSNSGK